MNLCVLNFHEVVRYVELKCRLSSSERQTNQPTNIVTYRLGLLQQKNSQNNTIQFTVSLPLYPSSLYPLPPNLHSPYTLPPSLTFHPNPLLSALPFSQQK